jgi:hypothetical protein
MQTIVVIDAHGGGLGAAIVKSLRERFADSIDIFALGTNAIATTAMKKSGASRCATGENAVCVGVRHADIIVGGIGIIAANSMLGEITPRMAQEISQCRAKKVLIPMSKCSFFIPGTADKPLGELIAEAADTVASLL